jgi:hypothetical protein
MPKFTASRKRVLIWALVKMFLTVCDRQHDAAAAISLDQPLTLSVAQIARHPPHALTYLERGYGTTQRVCCLR